ncbi:MAG TPA: hypothetical protein VMT35_19790 [Ignavibacteriaceae bacterium]|nr:hypothetical protein [Ignavibacteriaceae bacterium]
MKKGCFIKTVIIFTVLIAAVLFLIQNFPDIFLKPGEKFIKGLVFKGFTKELEHVKETPEKDSLKVLIDNFVHNRFKSKKNIEINSDEMEELVDSVKSTFADSLITPGELQNIKKLFESK